MTRPWSVTLLLLVLLHMFAEDFPATLSSEFFLSVAVAVMLGVLSSVFFFLNRADAGDVDERSHA